jgi:hypothetical protein
MKRAPKSRGLIAAFALVLATATLHAGSSVPDGTVLPARLNSTLSSKNSKTGQTVTARIMQDVPLRDLAKIPEGALIAGHVTGVIPASNGIGGSISVRFDFLKMPHEQIALTTHLRAIASFMAVEGAQVPLMGGDRGTSQATWTTVQIGGEVVYRGGGHVEGKFGRVGEPVYDGVLSHLNPNPDGNCGASDAGDLPQALWVFSSDACGPYGLTNLIVAHTGRTSPAGEITLRSSKGDVSVHSGAGLLLRTGAATEPHA